ncbi:MAG: aldo/keto reductase [Candidatus Bathyarchaeota archaeon]|nr:aldo/keto reductase [Candidatus Bathyarchaeota archaeon]
MVMESRLLGKTGRKVGVIGLGFEHLKTKSEKEIDIIVSTAIDAGINYFDLVWSLPHLLSGIGSSLKKRREEVVLAVHLGSGHSNGKYKLSRDPVECETMFMKALKDLGTDYADIVNIHYIKDMKTWKQVKKNGVINAAFSLKDRGLVRNIAVGTHSLEVVRLVAEEELFDSVMYQINLANHCLPDRNTVLDLCKSKGVGVVAMKPFAAGRLLRAGEVTMVQRWQSGGQYLKMMMPEITTTQCLSYSLAQPGVCVVVAGPSSLTELERLIGFNNAKKDEVCFEHLLDAFTN